MEEGAVTTSSATTLTFQFKSLSFPPHSVILPQPLHQISTAFFACPLGTLWLSVCDFWMSSFFLVGLESANFLVFTLTAKLLLPLFMKVMPLGSRDAELIY